MQGPILVPPGFQSPKATFYKGALTDQCKGVCAAAILAVLCVTAGFARQQLKEELSHKTIPAQTDVDLLGFAL